MNLKGTVEHITKIKCKFPIGINFLFKLTEFFFLRDMIKSISFGCSVTLSCFSHHRFISIIHNHKTRGRGGISSQCTLMTFTKNSEHPIPKLSNLLNTETKKQTLLPPLSCKQKCK